MRGGGGGPSPTVKKQSGKQSGHVFYSLQMGSNGLIITKKTILLQGSRGVQHFPGGEGVQMLISRRIHITCDFLGGLDIPPSGSAPEHLSPFWVSLRP